MLTVDIDRSAALYVSHTGASEDGIDFAGTYGDIRISTRFAGITAAIDTTGNLDASHWGRGRCCGWFLCVHLRQWALRSEDCHQKQQPSYRPCHCPISHICLSFNR